MSQKNEKLKVELTHEDIADLAEYMNNELSEYKLSQGFLEFIICNFIKSKRNINFFEEELRDIHTRSRNYCR